MRRGRGFTLMEVAIAVIVLAIVATVVVPRFSGAGIAENRMDDLCNRLQLLRSQIELYKVQHRGRTPMRTAEGAIDFDLGFEQMLCCSAADGTVKSDRPRTKRDDVHIYGPYLDRVPRNPFNGSETVVRARSRDEVPVEGGAGWAYVPETGEIYANHSTHHAGL